MTLFPRAELDTFAFGQMLDDAEVLDGLQQLGRLQHLQRAGYWGSLTEQSVESSFVERVFADVFGYRTLLGPNDRDVEHELRSKLYVPLAGARSFPDFALGFFRADAYETVVTAELKGPEAELDKPQSGNYGGKTPVEQAMAAAVGAKAEWCIVSNTNEVRLYRVPCTSAFECVDLREVLSPADFRRAHALFSRRSLLGSSSTDPSPLTRFHTHIVAGESMLVDAHPDRVRLVQRIRPKLKDGKEYIFTKLSASLRYA
ncbi:MAG: hypothetical protein JO257_08305, partial [Deltaproteobacteria bacterium]|nr:hypothetical protein [Deltaproteobacteria bacterium]